MILTRSPYYVNVPIAFPTTTNSVTLSLKVWSGLQASVPTTANYIETKNVPTTTTSNLSINISNMINDFIDQTTVSKSTTGLITLSNSHAVWIEYTVVYNDTVETIADLTGTFLASEGYGEYMQGSNPDIPTNMVLLDGNDFQMSRTGVFMIPFVNDGTISSVSVTNGTTQTQYNPSTSTNSDSIINYLYLIGSDYTEEYIDVSFDLHVVRIYIIDEYKYTPNDVCFINKYGMQQVIPFFRDKKESLSVRNNKFKNNVVSNNTYNASKHQIKQTNKEGNKKFNMVSGYYEEENNEHFEQLLLSEQVFLLENQVFTPINVDSSSLTLKTQLRDKLISYNISFSYAFDYINNV